jgi:type VI protein secretion system component Hcp
MSEDIKKTNEGLEQKNEELPAEALENISGGTAAEGKVSVHDINITKKVDKASPHLFLS